MATIIKMMNDGEMIIRHLWLSARRAKYLLEQAKKRQLSVPEVINEAIDFHQDKAGT